MTWRQVAATAVVVGASAVGSGRPVHGADDQARAEALRAVAIPVRSIDFEDEDFSDLTALKDVLSGARVVVLGEATHSHGSTTAAKARMVRFLHREMGFDVLAWETGLVQTWAMNASLRDAETPIPSAAGYLMSGGWATESPVRSMLAYARSSWRTNRPLLMAGFDGDRPTQGARSLLLFLRDLGSRSPSLALDEASWRLVASLASRSFGFLGGEQPDEAQRSAERRVVNELLAHVRESLADPPNGASAHELVLADRFLTHLLACDAIKSHDRSDWASARDGHMADNFLWLLDTLYPDRKIIVWAATAHFIRHSDRIHNDEHPDWYKTAWQAGNFIYPRLKDGLYTIAFTSYSGRSGDLFPPESQFESSVSTVAPAPAGSFEAAAHALEQPVLFVDLRGAPVGHWLGDSFVSVCLGRLANRAKWSEIVDGFFFIDQASPCEHLPLN